MEKLRWSKLQSRRPGDRSVGEATRPPALFTHRMLVAGSLGTLRSRAAPGAHFEGWASPARPTILGVFWTKTVPGCGTFMFYFFYFLKNSQKRQSHEYGMPSFIIFFWFSLNRYLLIHSFIYFYWSIVVGQCCVGFCYGVARMWLVVSDSLWPRGL